MRQHYFVDWEFGVKRAIENVVREREKWDAHLSERRVAANRVAIAQGVYSSP